MGLKELKNKTDELGDVVNASFNLLIKTIAETFDELGITSLKIHTAYNSDSDNDPVYFYFLGGEYVLSRVEIEKNADLPFKVSFYITEDEIGTEEKLQSYGLSDLLDMTYAIVKEIENPYDGPEKDEEEAE